MSLYKEFGPIFPYLTSIRKLENYLSFDIEFPKKWKVPKKYVIEDQVVERTDVNSESRSFSFVCPFNENTLEETLKNLKSIVSFNKEIEEKEKLFNSKVMELKNIFEKQNLEKLHNLKFELINNEITLDGGEEEDK
jgi:hypothetical protein